MRKHVYPVICGAQHVRITAISTISFMTFNTENLLLDSEYEFNVTVEYEREQFAAKLTLKKNAVYLRISGEQGEDRRRSLPWGHISRIECSEFSSKISLFDIRPMSGFSRIISRNPFRVFFESEYEVGFVLFSKTQLENHRSFRGIKVHSDTISKWLGNTEKQEEIIKLYKSNVLFQTSCDNLTEFSCIVPGKGVVGASYNPIAFHCSPEFKAGITYPPSLFFIFNQKASAEVALQATADVITFFKFVTGGNVEISKVEFVSSEGSSRKNATLYFPRKNSNRSQVELIFFPLGKNLRFDTLGLPEFPVVAIQNFFSQDLRKINFFRQYMKYRDMKSDEERFLGFFRLLEALTYKEGRYLDEAVLLEVMTRAKAYLVRKFGDRASVTSFIKRMPRWNSLKYNAEKCIVDLLDSIPKSVSEEWKYGTKDIGAICKLRNDITHANDYEASASTVSDYTKFVEILVIYSLLLQIGVEKKSAAVVLCRLSGYHEIKQIDT